MSGRDRRKVDDGDENTCLFCWFLSFLRGFKVEWRGWVKKARENWKFFFFWNRFFFFFEIVEHQPRSPLCLSWSLKYSYVSLMVGWWIDFRRWSCELKHIITVYIPSDLACRSSTSTWISIHSSYSIEKANQHHKYSTVTVTIETYLSYLHFSLTKPTFEGAWRVRKRSLVKLLYLNLHLSSQSLFLFLSLSHSHIEDFETYPDSLTLHTTFHLPFPVLRSTMLRRKTLYLNSLSLQNSHPLFSYQLTPKTNSFIHSFIVQVCVSLGLYDIQN